LIGRKFMTFNLIHDPWIPLSDNGVSRVVRPAEVIADREPSGRLAWPRADFTGATWEFLIGLVHCSSLCPADDTAWKAVLDQPPGLDAVTEALTPLAQAFTLDGPGPRFLQDPSAADGKEVGIHALLIDSPGENALTRNLDVFVKRGTGARACPSCAAAALYTMQTYAPSGGQGHRTSLRGGGPLTTLVLADTPSRTVWANVIPRTVIDRQIGGDAQTPGLLFPWMEPPRLGEGAPSETRPGQAPFLQAFWGQPRRFWLDFDAVERGVCALCGQASDRLVTTFRSKPRGVNYEGGWRHPLSAYAMEPGKPETAIARKGTPTGPDYRDWLALTLGKAEKKWTRMPALAVSHFREKSPKRTPARLWAFGYDTDNMKARGWNDSRMPLYPALRREDLLIAAVERAMAGADLALWALRSCLREAILGDAGAKADFLAEGGMVLDRTAGAFHALLDQLVHRDREAESNSRDAVNPLLRVWHGAVAHAALAAFDGATEGLPINPGKARGKGAEAGETHNQQFLARRRLLGVLWGGKMEKEMALSMLRPGKKEVA
jgi:CRISPR system Cascade subunit CasA